MAPPRRQSLFRPHSGFMLTTLLLLVTLLAPLTYTSHPDTDPVPLLVRRHWMREAKKFLFAANGGSPCPFAAFGAAIVNHTSTVTGGGDGDDDGDEKGELICLGYNTVRRDGNPTLHGEIAAINNCTAILTSPDGPYRLTGEEALEALKSLSLYTTAEACPMCAAAIANSHFREYIFATSSPYLAAHGWPQFSLRSLDILASAPTIPISNYGSSSEAGSESRQIRIVQNVLADETDGLFGWQFDLSGACPVGCVRDAGDGGDGCVPAGGEGVGVGGRDEL